MCGIAGAVWNDPSKALEAATLQRMIDVLRHRGPDGEGTFGQWPSAGGEPGVALGHRRLSIIDVACGRQPLSNEDQSVWVVFNGEIYNFRDLRRQLEARGHRFRTRSDTEVLVHLYEDQQADMLGRLNGMFALAIWDARRRQLLLARDRLGKKPLVYCNEPGRLLFASELKSLLQVEGVPRQIDPQALDEYLAYQYVPHPRTIFRGIQKLPPGHFALWRDGRLDVRPYWQPDFNRETIKPRPPVAPGSATKPRPPAAPGSATSETPGGATDGAPGGATDGRGFLADGYPGELRALLTSAVELRLQSDVPLGAFLSGGIDSTIVVGLMSQLAGGGVRTFSIGFPVKEFDETSYARQAAQRFGTIHEEFQVRPDAMEVLPRLVWHYDEPFADSSALPTWYVSQLTRQHVTVALTGDGGDELFGGYPRYQAVWLAGLFDRLPAWLRRMIAGNYWQRLPSGTRQKSRRRQFKRFVEMLGLPPARRYLEWISVFGQSRRNNLLSDDFRAALPADEEPLDFLSAALARTGRRDAVTAFSLADLITYLPCDLMTKVDIASMAHSLECRQPFLDYRVVELAARMPIGLKFRRGLGKRILRETFADLLPHDIQRRAKMGFGVPLDHWFRHELKDFSRDVLLDRKTLDRPYFRPAAVRQLLDEHQTSRFNHGYRLWSLLFFELWHREWMG